MADLGDEDVEQADIECWGTPVIWAEEYTGMARWDAQPVGDDRWSVLEGVAYRYVRWQFEGVRCWDEIGPDGWAGRHIEADSNGRYLAAAALSEVIAVRETGGTDAVIAYEQVYGVAPEGTFPPGTEPELTPISGKEFVERWIAARRELESGVNPTS